jgi:hypothetical protein
MASSSVSSRNKLLLLKEGIHSLINILIPQPIMPIYFSMKQMMKPFLQKFGFHLKKVMSMIYIMYLLVID